MQEAIFTCVMEKLPKTPGEKWEQFQVVREFMDGESDVLSEGCYYACRSSIDRYYRFLSSQEKRYSVYWLNEFSFEVHGHYMAHCA